MEGIDSDPIFGEPLANYPSDRTRPLIIAGVVCALVSVLLNFTLAQVPNWWGPVSTIVIMALLVLVCAWYLLHLWNREIVLYARGFSYREGSNTVFFFYEEIRSIRLRAERLAYFGGLIRRSIYRFTVTTRQDESFTITNLYLRADELGTKLTDQINRILEPDIAHRLEAGEKVAFGDTLTLDMDGLKEGSRTLVWAEYGGYRLGNHRLSLLDRAGAVWYSLPIPEVDNITLLLERLRQRQSVNKPTS
ncbi:MAG TPA: DUF6585 family protein [Phototrophicaceae bacterium]|nr:DUF6585 family protein [Phototrophicaceae bacterium]